MGARTFWLMIPPLVWMSSCGSPAVDTSDQGSAAGSSAVPSRSELPPGSAPVSAATTLVSAVAVPISTAAPLAPVSTAVATADSVVAPASTTPFPDDALTIVIDLTRNAPRLEPRVVASRPWSTTDFMTSVVVAVGAANQIAVLDTVDGVVEFIDAASGEVVRQEELLLAPDARPWMFLGPDDVLYVNHVDVEHNRPEFVAFAPTDTGYREVARTMHGIGDSTLMLGMSGITGLVGDPPVVPFVGVDGQPSGATLAIEPFRFAPGGAEEWIARGNSAWKLSYIGQPCEGCQSLQPGPGETAVVTEPLVDDGSPHTRIALLDKTSMREWDSTWGYLGPIEGGFVVARIVDDRIEIGVVDI